MDRVPQFGTRHFQRRFVEAFSDESERSREAARQPPRRLAALRQQEATLA